MFVDPAAEIPGMKRLVAALAIFLFASLTHAEDWPAWRGPRLDGTSLEKNLPLQWSDKDNVAWKAPIPGIGHSSPIIFGNRVFVTSCLLKDQQRVLICLERTTGKILWQRDVAHSPLEKKHGLNSHSSSTPATDGKYVYVAFLRLREKTAGDGPPQLPRVKSPISPELIPEMLVAAYDFDGNKVWEKVPGRFYSQHGFCSSPILYKDKIIVNGDQDALAYIVALDKTTGEEKWRVNRPSCMRSYCAPLIVDAAGKTQMVLTGNLGIHSYNPENGAPIWNINGPTEQYVASLVYGDGLFFMTAGFPDFHNLAIRPDGQGDITKTHIVWHEAKTKAINASYVPSPLAVGKFFYMISDKGYLSCFQAKSGERSFMEKLGRHHSASPVLGDGRVYLTDDDGITYVLSGDGKFNVLARNELREECYASPAIANGQVFIRTLHNLYCIGKK
jgi:outer membrane protein assembly factor BamB